MKEWTIVNRGCIKKVLVDTVAYVFTDTLLLDSHSPYFLKNDLKSLKEKALKMIPKYGKTFFFLGIWYTQ